MTSVPGPGGFDVLFYEVMTSFHVPGTSASYSMKA